MDRKMEAKRQCVKVEYRASKEAPLWKREAALEASRSERQDLLRGDRYAVLSGGGTREELFLAFAKRVDARVEAVRLRVEEARLLVRLFRPPCAHEQRPPKRHPPETLRGALVEQAVVGLFFERLQLVAIARRTLERHRREARRPRSQREHCRQPEALAVPRRLSNKRARRIRLIHLCIKVNTIYS